MTHGDSDVEENMLGIPDVLILWPLLSQIQGPCGLQGLSLHASAQSPLPDDGPHVPMGKGRIRSCASF